MNLEILVKTKFEMDDFSNILGIEDYEFYSGMLVYIDKYNYLNFIMFKKKKFRIFKKIKKLLDFSKNIKNFTFTFSIKNNWLIIELPKLKEYIIVDKTNWTLLTKNKSDKNYGLIIRNNHIILNFKEEYSKILKLNDNSNNYEFMMDNENILFIEKISNYYVFKNKDNKEFLIFDLFLNKKFLNIKIKQYEFINNFLIIRLYINSLEIFIYDANNLELITKSNNGYNKLNSLIFWELKKNDYIVFDSITKRRIYFEGINYDEKIMKIKQHHDFKDWYIISVNKTKYLFYSHDINLNEINKINFKELPDRFELKAISLFNYYLCIIYNNNNRKIYDIKNKFNIVNFENIPSKQISLIQNVNYSMLNVSDCNFIEVDSYLLKFIFNDGSVSYYNKNTFKELKIQDLKSNSNIIGVIEIYDYIFMQFINGYYIYNKKYNLVSIKGLKSGVLIVNMSIFSKILKLKTQNFTFFYFNLDNGFKPIEFKKFDTSIEIIHKFYLNNNIFIKLINGEYIIIDDNYKKIELERLESNHKITSAVLISNIFKFQINNEYFLYYSAKLNKLNFEQLSIYDEINDIKIMNNKFFVLINYNLYFLYNNNYKLSNILDTSEVRNIYTFNKFFILEYKDNSNSIFDQNFSKLQLNVNIENCNFIKDIVTDKALLIIKYNNKNAIYSNNLNIKHKIIDIPSNDQVYLEKIKNTKYYNIKVESLNSEDQHYLLDHNLELFTIEDISIYDKILRIFEFKKYCVIKTEKRMNLFYDNNFKKIKLKGIEDEDIITYVDNFNNTIILRLNDMNRFLVFNNKLESLNIKNFKEDIIKVSNILDYLIVKTKDYMFFVNSKNFKHFVIKGVCKFKNIYEDKNLLIFKISEEEYQVYNIKNLKKINFENIFIDDIITYVIIINEYIVLQIDNKDYYFYNKDNYTLVDFEKDRLDGEKIIKIQQDEDIINFETDEGNNYFDKEYFDKLKFQGLGRKDVIKKIHKSDDSDYYRVEIKNNYYSYYDIETYEKKVFEGISNNNTTSEHKIIQDFLIMKVNNNWFKIYDKNTLEKINIHGVGGNDLINDYKIISNAIVLFINNKHYLLYDIKTFECIDYFLNKNDRIIQVNNINNDNKFVLLRINQRIYYLFDTINLTRIFFENSEIIKEFELLNDGECIRILNGNNQYFYYWFCYFKIMNFEKISSKIKIVDICYLDKYIKIKTNNRNYFYYYENKSNNWLELVDFKVNNVEILNIFSINNYLIVKLANNRYSIYTNDLEKIYLNKIWHSDEITFVNKIHNFLIVGINNRIYFNYDCNSLEKLYLKKLGLTHKIIDIVKFQRIFTIKTNYGIYLNYKKIYNKDNTYEYKNYIFPGIKKFETFDEILEYKHFYRVIYQGRIIFYYKKDLKRLFLRESIDLLSIKDIILITNVCIKIIFKNSSKKYIFNIS